MNEKNWRCHIINHKLKNEKTQSKEWYILFSTCKRVDVEDDANIRCTEACNHYSRLDPGCELLNPGKQLGVKRLHSVAEEEPLPSVP